jgi:hypothetical protein
LRFFTLENAVRNPLLDAGNMSANAELLVKSVGRCIIFFPAKLVHANAKGLRATEVEIHGEII